MFDLYRQTRQPPHQQRQEFWQAAWAMMGAEPWRFVTRPLSLAVALLLEWALSQPHSPAFWWLTALGFSAVLLGDARLQVYAQARWARQQPQEKN